MLAATPPNTNLFRGKHPAKVCIEITRFLNKLLTHGAAVSETREERRMTNECGKKERTRNN